MTIRDNNNTFDRYDRPKSVEFYSSPTPDFPYGKLLKKITYNYDWAGRMMERSTTNVCHAQTCLCVPTGAFFCSCTSRYTHCKNAPSASHLIRSESLLPNPNGGFGIEDKW